MTRAQTVRGVTLVLQARSIASAFHNAIDRLVGKAVQLDGAPAVDGIEEGSVPRAPSPSARVLSQRFADEIVFAVLSDRGWLILRAACPAGQPALRMTGENCAKRHPD